MLKLPKHFILAALLVTLLGMWGGRCAWAQPSSAAVAPPAAAPTLAPVDSDNALSPEDAADAKASPPPSPFDAERGTWVNGLARKVWGLQGTPKVGDHEVQNKSSVSRDVGTLALMMLVIITVVMVIAARGHRLRPEGKPHSLTNFVEFMVESYREYLISVMGNDLAKSYTPLISSFFFCILFMNWLGLIPGLTAPTANPNVPVSMGIVAFFCVHIIAIKETGVKSWLLHFVGEPLWLAPLNIPLHIVGEIVKPISLSLRLLCNVFGEEMVTATLATLALAMLPRWLPIPFQLPMLFLGAFFGFLQALVFSTLLAIYISIFSTKHDDHDAHNEHGHVEHVRTFGHNSTVAHPTEWPVA